ncbi:methylmalonyl-CoA mutase subunit beta [Dactylosporangium matsuzakiense]|uniref:methylmalonyl-CoA mutase n=1 Tax=Dactylosporangium matsuzakiense TaxID=53360 RepID=A0A9W6KCY0_9ACTN|nr:methylmalonyl-CoA mutase subunit beta [Dactylosporangium matsuzakiense]UWZ47206.1 methylmalonyl-CoA mutase small subunit [Dactylosporangium matsuzakiense]GLK98349.1 methylmalonyl-CoA mutase [Dactylosporangium matsuzakiense]
MSDLLDWQRLALGVLRKSGRADEDTPPEAVADLLATDTYDGVRIAPLYTAADPAPPAGQPGHVPFVRGGHPAPRPWDVRQRHADPDPKVTRAAVLADLENGATSLWLAGIAPADLAEALDGVLLDLAGVVLDNGADTLAAARAFLALPGAGKSGNLGADPLGLTARTGTVHDTSILSELSKMSGVPVATVDATVYHDAGGSDAQELGYATATGLAYLRELVGAGLSAGMALQQLEFRFAATADQFATIAKLRAARRIWSRVAQVCEVPHLGAQRQHAVTSSAMMTARDPWTNLLRTTIACFAAGAGGADAVTVQPFDARLGLPDAFSRRIARNTQSLLIEESGAARVLDPAGGSWYVESLTDALAHAAWDVFTEVERAGGMAAALRSGLVADRIGTTWERRHADLAHRRQPITGVSEFPDLAERRPVRPSAPLPPSGGLPQHWYSQSFELLRDAADARADPPTVRLVALGPTAAHSARVSFATNLFAAGGVRLTADSTSPVACICGSDRSYASGVAELAARLRAEGVTRIWLAGQGPYDGVDSYLYMGCDALDVLRQTHLDLGVAQ